MTKLMKAPDGEQMNVPEEKVAEFESKGWLVVEVTPPPWASPPEKVQTDEGEKEPAEVVEELAGEAVKDEDDKSDLPPVVRRRKGKK